MFVILQILFKIDFIAQQLINIFVEIHRAVL